MTKHTSKATTSTTIEAQIDDILFTLTDQSAWDIVGVTQEQHDELSEQLNTDRAEAKTKLLKAIEAEKLKGQIELLDYLRQDAGYGEYTATEYRDAIELRIQSLQQQLWFKVGR